jgi:hypothetical protein
MCRLTNLWGLKMNRHDRDALTQALAMCRNESTGRAWQIDSMLQNEPWVSVAKFCSHVCQRRSLHLLPWEAQPMYGDVDASWRDPQAEKLLQQMLAAGVSKFHPTPMEAIAAAKRKGAA